jgi:hypothetical protein
LSNPKLTKLKQPIRLEAGGRSVKVTRVEPALLEAAQRLAEGEDYFRVPYEEWNQILIEKDSESFSKKGGFRGALLKDQAFGNGVLPDEEVFKFFEKFQVVIRVKGRPRVISVFRKRDILLSFKLKMRVANRK